MFCENSLLIMVKAPQWQKRKQFCTLQDKQPPLRVGHHKIAANGGTQTAMVFQQEKVGRSRPPRQSAVFMNVPHVQNKYKLQDETGKIVRIPGGLSLHSQVLPP
jgi:hypothetical protein